MAAGAVACASGCSRLEVALSSWYWPGQTWRSDPPLYLEWKVGTVYKLAKDFTCLVDRCDGLYWRLTGLSAFRCGEFQRAVIKATFISELTGAENVVYGSPYWDYTVSDL